MRVWQSGARWALGAMSVALEGTRREAPEQNPEQRVGVTFGAGLILRSRIVNYVQDPYMPVEAP